jgi:hypothetical protein
MNILVPIFAKKNTKEPWPEVYLVQDPDPYPDAFKSQIRIWPKIVRIRNTALENSDQVLYSKFRQKKELVLKSGERLRK